MKKLFIVLILSLVFSSVSAQNLTVTGCLELDSNLRVGLKDKVGNSNVTLLQSFLNSKGYLKVAPTGYFGTQTLLAVKSFQKANSIVNTGFVGPLTRAAIKSVSCSDTAVETTPQPQSPVEIPPVPTVPVESNTTPPPATTPPQEDVILTAPNNSSLRVRTEGVISLTSVSAVVRGSITAGARSATERWFEFTKNPEVYKLSETTLTQKRSQRANENFEETLSGLLPNTTYYYRVCAENADLGQKSCGATASFKTNNI